MTLPFCGKPEAVTAHNGGRVYQYPVAEPDAVIQRYVGEQLRVRANVAITTNHTICPDADALADNRSGTDHHMRADTGVFCHACRGINDRSGMTAGFVGRLGCEHMR